MMKRFLAHRIITADSEYKLAVLTVSDDRKNFEIHPFDGETEATVFVSGTIKVNVSDGVCRLYHDGKPLSLTFTDK